MSLRLASLLIISLFAVALLAAPVLGISVSVSTGNGNGMASSSSSYSLDDSTSLNEQTTLKDSELQKSLQASGTGKNEISQQMTGGSSSLQSSAISQGSLDLSSSGYASAGSASLGVGVAAQGDLSLSGQASQGQAESGQKAGVADGAISTSQSLSAGQGALSSQSTEMAGVAGYVASAAFSQQNEMVATGSFLGEGLLSADLGAVAAERAATSGQASMDGVTYLRDATMQEISSESLGMSMMGLRETGNGIGTFEMNVFNREAADNYAYDQAADTAGGSTSSYVLTGYRWNQNNPQIQLYLNPANAPSSMPDSGITQAAIAASANTWDNAVAQNLFIDTNTVKVDSSKTVDDPNANPGVSDNFNVHGWWNLGGTTLGLSRTWYRPDLVVGGYKSVIESDVWYASDKSWSTTGTGGTYDLQTVATHELGHSIGMGDLYTLPSTDPRKNDYAQVMNSYDAPQRTLGNGDRTGAQILYGSKNDGTWYLNDNRDGKTYYSTYFGGIPGDVPVTGDWDGDGVFGIGVYRSGTWYLNDNRDGQTYYSTYFGGIPGDVPVTGDWDGDGVFGIGVYRSGTWYLNENRDGKTYYSTYFGGIPGDIPVTGDWDGNGAFGIGVYRSGPWYLNENRDGKTFYSTYFGGISGDIPVTGDWDGNGAFGIGVYRSGPWYLNENRDGKTFYSTYFGGISGDIPVTGDWDGNGAFGVGIHR